MSCQYFGFVYLWRDRKRKRYYIGSHRGRIDDGYISSSIWMRRTYHRRPEDFKRRILVYCFEESKKALHALEQVWLDKIKNDELGKRYFNLKKAARGGQTDSSENISRKQKLSWTPERKAKWVAKMAEWRDRDPTAKAKLATMVGRTHSISVLEKIGAGNKGKIMSNEVKAIMSEKAQARAHLTAERNKQLHAAGKIGMRGRQHSAETKAKMSEANRLRWAAKRTQKGARKIKPITLDSLKGMISAIAEARATAQP